MLRKTSKSVSRFRRLISFGLTIISSYILMGVVTAIYLPEYVPDSGYYYLSKDYVYSIFRWHEHGFNQTYQEAYEHEFRVNNRGFARVTGYWSSNLPQAYLDVEDDYWGPYVIDEFVIGCDDAEATVAGQTYFMYIDLTDQDSDVTSSSTILEAELCWDFLGSGSNNWPMEWYTITSFTAPSYGSWFWDSIQPMSSESQKNKGKEVGNEPLENIIGAVVSFNRYAGSEEIDFFLSKFKVKPIRTWFKSHRYEFGGGFYINKSVEEALNVVSGNLEYDLFKTMVKLSNTKCNMEWDILKKIEDQIKKNIQALREENLYGIEVKGDHSELAKLGEDPLIANIQYYELSKGGKFRPIEPNTKP